MGCGECYWCEWKNDPPECCDPCDCCGNWIGNGHGGYYGHPGYHGHPGYNGHPGMAVPYDETYSHPHDESYSEPYVEGSNDPSMARRPTKRAVTPTPMASSRASQPAARPSR